jgi:hypothetical protein
LQKYVCHYEDWGLLKLAMILMYSFIAKLHIIYEGWSSLIITIAMKQIFGIFTLY